MRTDTGWTDKRVEELRKLWDEGLSALQCSIRLGGGLTRNAVIGKVHRLGLTLRGTAGRRSTLPKVRQRRLLRGKQKTSYEPGRPLASLPLPVPRPDDIARVSFADLENHHCRYPIGEPTTGFCGLKAAPGLPYCEGHQHVCTSATHSYRAPWQRRSYAALLPTFYDDTPIRVAKKLKEIV